MNTAAPCAARRQAVQFAAKRRIAQGGFIPPVSDKRKWGPRAGSAKRAAWGRNAGGEVVCTGTPEEVAACEGSYTGKYLKKVLK